MIITRKKLLIYFKDERVEKRMKKILKSTVVLMLVTVLCINLSFAGTYMVKPNDVLWKIADKFGVTVNQLKAENDLEDVNKIYPGQVLKVNDVVSKDAPKKDVASTDVPQKSVASSDVPKYVFMFIGDGLGSSQRQISEYYLKEQTNDTSKKLLMNTFGTSGINTTHSADTLITDSAAAGTALSSGIKTNNGYIAQDVNGNDVETLVELAEKEGRSTGLVSTTRLTHATPASFAAHNINRNDENAIAEDFLVSGVDFFAGGGLRHFIPSDYGTDTKDYTGATIKSKREDNRNLVDEFAAKGYQTFTGKEGTDAFKKASFDEEGQVFAAFTYTHMPYEIDRMNSYTEIPSIAEMTDKAIDSLEEDEDGFFLMVEGGRIDHAAHANDAASVINDTLAFDDAVKEAYEFYEEHPEETLILVVGDHETGGLGLGMDTQGYFVDLAPLMSAKASIADEVLYGNASYNGDREAFINYAKINLGLNDLTEKELAKLNAGMDSSDAGESFGYYGYDPAGMALTHIISERANIFWTTTIHTGTAIPMSATGLKSETFGGYKDNTEIAKNMADILGYELNK